MRNINSDLFDPGTAVMESDYSRGASASDADFGFAFNDSNFSDRILRIEIMGDPVEARADSEGCTSIADWARHRKRRREDIKKENGISLYDIYYMYVCEFMEVFASLGNLGFLKELVFVFFGKILRNLLKRGRFVGFGL